ncbi:tRNA synthetases class I, catalytic domain-containing protein [Scenedesmus sp. NREL 46B-D3]|nr:tRNA synthetases class I, catalytic domain-containing protein [Scenedesmus sp. NREL 46B-D3]
MSGPAATPSIPLPHAVPGAVVTRFPPEPSWHLDIGHCKAALMNQLVAAQFQGRWILRFDDTNPKTCSGPCVESYLREMPLLGLRPDAASHASDYFAPMIADAAALIQSGLLYADDTPVELMRQQRLARQASPARDRPAAASLAAWAEMQAGSAAGQACCLRFRLQPWSENGALRDPVAYRVTCSRTTGQVYPTYDYACPWLDAAQGVSHALRTLEFRDRDCLYEAVQRAVLGLHPAWQPTAIWEFPRIHMAHSPQAKVHQRALLAAGLVAGPDDPRLPTLAGMMRAGCHPDALRAFLLEQARLAAHLVTPARKETYHSWDKLWTLNRRRLDPRSSRHMAVEDAGRALLAISGGPDQPQPVEVAWKQGHVVQVVRYKQLWLDQADATLLSVGDDITLLAWGNATITSVTRAPATAAAAGDADSFQDVLALRDQLLMSAGGSNIRCSSCASTAGSTVGAPSICTMDQEELEQAREQGKGQQQQQQQQQQQPQQHDREDEDLSAPLSPAATLGTAAAAAAAAVMSKPEAAAAGLVTQLTAVLHPSGDPKASKLKLHWLPALPELLLPLRLVSFSRPVLAERVVEEVDVVASFNHSSRRECLAWGDPSLLLSARKGAVVQLQRKGLYVVHEVQLKPGSAAASSQGGPSAVASDAAAASGASDNVTAPADETVVPTGAEDLKAAAASAAAPGVPLHKLSLAPGLSVADVQQLVLFAIPDGHTKHETV